MTNTHAHGNRGGMPSLAYGSAIALVTTLIVISVQYILLDRTNQPERTRMDMMNNAHTNYLRNHPHPIDLLQETTDGLFSHQQNAVARDDHKEEMLLPSSIWHDEFFSPLLESPFMDEFRRQHHMMMIEPAYKMDEDGDQVSLTMSIPAEVPLEDIDIEVIGRIVHIKGEKRTSNSHVSFDKRFSIGQHLNESNLAAKMTKDGKLVVTAPKVASGEKDEVRKIPVKVEL